MPIVCSISNSMQVEIGNVNSFKFANEYNFERKRKQFKTHEQGVTWHYSWFFNFGRETFNNK